MINSLFKAFKHSSNLKKDRTLHLTMIHKKLNKNENKINYSHLLVKL